MKTIADKNQGRLAHLAGGILEDSIKTLLEKQSAVVIGLVGGRSVVGMYEYLKNADIDWSRVHLFTADERLVSLDDPQSNYGEIRGILIDELLEKEKLPSSNVHAFDGGASSPDDELARYTAEFASLGGRYDIIVLGSGEDGHCAGLFPHHPALDVIDEPFVLMDDAPKPPSARMTSSRSLIERSVIGFMLFIGPSKRKPYEQFCDPDVDMISCPSKISLAIDELFVVTDIELDGEDKKDA